MTNLEYAVMTLPLVWLVAYAIVQTNDRRRQAKFDRHVEQALQITRPLGPSGEFWCSRCARMVTDPLAHIVRHPGD